MSDLNRHPWLGVERDEWRLAAWLVCCALLLVGLMVVSGI